MRGGEPSRSVDTQNVFADSVWWCGLEHSESRRNNTRQDHRTSFKNPWTSRSNFNYRDLSFKEAIPLQRFYCTHYHYTDATLPQFVIETVAVGPREW